MTTAMLICADCEDVILDLPHVDMVLTDPSFGISNKRNIANTWSGYTSMKGQWDNRPGMTWVYACVDRLKQGGMFATFGVFGSLIPIFGALSSLDMRFQSHCIWVKSNPAPCLHRRMYTLANEIILVFSKGAKWTFNYDVAKGLNVGKQLRNVWASGSVKRVLGRTRKPSCILDRLILPLTSEGDWILDPFCGTSSILEVAVAHGRNVIGIDNNREVIDHSYDALRSVSGCDVHLEDIR